MHFYKYPINTLDKATNPLFFFLFFFFFFWISEENFIQNHENESPKYTAGDQNNQIHKNQPILLIWPFGTTQSLYSSELA